MPSHKDFLKLLQHGRVRSDASGLFVRRVWRSPWQLVHEFRVET